MLERKILGRHGLLSILGVRFFQVKTISEDLIPGGSQSSNRIEASSYGMQESWVEIGAARVRYLRGGSGPSLVLVAGLWGYSFSWRHNLAPLAKHFTVYAPDLPGAGYSERPASLKWGLRDQAERLLAFMNAADISSAHIVASSHGGAVAMMMAIIARGRGGQEAGARLVHRLVMSAPVNPWAHLNPNVIALACTPVGHLLFFLGRPFRYQICRWCLRHIYGSPERVTPEVVDGYAAPLAATRSGQAQLAILCSWRRDLAELKRLLPAISGLPVLLVWGARDDVVSVASAVPLLRNFASSKLAIIAAAGHMPYEELPEEFNRLVLEFLLSETSPEQTWVQEP